MLTTRTRPAPEILGALFAFIIVKAKTGPVMTKTSKVTRNKAVAIEPAVFTNFDMIFFLVLNGVTGGVEKA